jgi:hypothetical protein
MEYFKVYTNYVNNYNSSISELQKCNKLPAFQKFLSKVICFSIFLIYLKHGYAKDLDMYLVLPIQRIPRYILLLQEMLKYTPSTHSDYPILEQALQKMKTIANYVCFSVIQISYFSIQINDTKREKDNANEISLVQERLYGREASLVSDAKKYLREGSLTEVSEDSDVQRYIFLFSNFLIVSKPKKSIFKGKDTFTACSYQYEIAINDSVTVSSLEDSEGIIYNVGLF